MPIRLIVEDEGGHHAITIRDDGEMVLHDHDMESELALLELGFEPSRCLSFYQEYREAPLQTISSLRLWSDNELHERWIAIVIEWIGEFTPCVEKELKKNQEALDFYKECLSELQSIFDNGPDWYSGSSAVQRRIDKLINKTMSEMYHQLAFPCRLSAIMLNAVAEAMRLAIEPTFEPTEDFFAHGIGTVLYLCKKAAGEEALGALDMLVDSGVVPRGVVPGDVEEKAEADEGESCLRIAIKILESPKVVRVMSPPSGVW